MTDHRDWTGQVGHIWATEWRRTDRSFGELTPQLLAAAEVETYAHALDIGCGAGELSVALASRYPDRHVTGVDISGELLAVARQRSGDFTNTAFAHADAATFEPRHAPDLLLSRHGVMFFRDPVAAFAHLNDRAARKARLAFSCFRTRGQNAWVTTVMGALAEAPAPPADPREPGPFAFGDRDHVDTVLREAGWREIAFHQIDYRMIFGAGEHPVSDAVDYLTRVGPTASPIAALPDEERAATLVRLASILDDHRQGDTVSLPASAWLVTARKG